MHHRYGYNVFYSRALLDDCSRFALWQWSAAERLDLVAAWRMGGEL